MFFLKITIFLFVCRQVAGKNVDEKLTEVLLSSDDLSCDAIITNETTLNLAQVVCKSPRSSFFFNLLTGVKYVLFGSLCACLQYFYLKSVGKNEVDLAVVEFKNTVVENISQIQVAPLTVVLKVDARPSLEIQPEVKELNVDETDGLPRGNTLEGRPSDDETTTTPEIGERPQDKINERKPMVFVGGVSASTTPIELVSEFRKQGFNVTVLPRIRYGVSFGFCPDLVLSSIEEVEELLDCERVWVKDRWVDIRPYIPKDCPTAAVATQHRDEAKEEQENVEYINVEDLLNTTPSLHATCTPPLGSPIHFGQPYIYPLGSPIYVPHQFYPQHSPEFPFLNSHAMQTLDTFHHQPISQSNSMQT